MVPEMAVMRAERKVQMRTDLMAAMKAE